ncbi:MAG: ABC transporter ATP-binding protein [Lutisporaceae bacterium]
MEYIVNIEKLTRKYTSGGGLFKKKQDTVTAVNNVSFKVKKGEAIGILGPNGAGKTTLIKMLTTILVPTSGKVTILGKDLIKDANEIRKKVNVVYGGDKGLYTRLSAKDNLKYFCNLYHVPVGQQKEKIERLLEMVNLSDVADRRIENFSRGMRQRLHIARGLINDPEILFLDEPTIGLDPVSSLSIRKLIKSLNENGMTIFLTTHYMQEAEEICDRVAIIRKGNMVLLDDVENVKVKFKKNYYIELTLGKNSDSIITALKSSFINVNTTDKNNDIILVTFESNDIVSVMQELPDILGVSEILDFNVKTGTLEDAYIEIIQNNK